MQELSAQADSAGIIYPSRQCRNYLPKQTGQELSAQADRAGIICPSRQGRNYLPKQTGQELSAQVDRAGIICPSRQGRNYLPKHWRALVRNVFLLFFLLLLLFFFFYFNVVLREKWSRQGGPLSGVPLCVHLPAANDRGRRPCGSCAFSTKRLAYLSRGDAQDASFRFASLPFSCLCNSVFLSTDLPAANFILSDLCFQHCCALPPI